MKVVKFVAAALVFIGLPTGFWAGMVEGVVSPWMSAAHPFAPLPGLVVVVALAITLLPWLLLSKLSGK